MVVQRLVAIFPSEPFEEEPDRPLVLVQIEGVFVLAYLQARYKFDKK
jgi:hypothetical protein